VAWVFRSNNRGALFVLDGNDPDPLASRKRPFHTIIPAFMERGDIHIGFGIAGGSNQPLAYAQFVSSLVDYGMNIQAALETPRFTIPDTGTRATGCDILVESRVTQLTTGVPATLTPLRFAFPGQAGSRNAFRGQGFFGIDASLTKSWKVSERVNLKFAWDVFNITNSVRFDTNSTDNGSDDGGFGLYSGTLTNPRVQQFSLRLTF